MNKLKFLLKFLLISLVLQATLNAQYIVRDLADIPINLRQENWGTITGGSCAHASAITLLRWHSYDYLADWWRTSYSGGEILPGTASKLTHAKVKYAYTNKFDMSFLTWCARNRLGAIIYHVPAFHAVNMVDLTPTEVYLLDNNRIQDYIIMNRRIFENQWRTNNNGTSWALTIVDTPPPPWPVVNR